MANPWVPGHSGAMADTSEALSWIGYRVDDVYGARIGVVEDVYVDQTTDSPCWLLTKMGRFSEVYALIPVQDAVAGSGHVWVPYEKDLIRRAPQFSVGMPVTQQAEVTLCAHYGVMSSRGTEIANASPAAITAASLHGPPPVSSRPEAHGTT